jgi:hypothetical protein
MSQPRPHFISGAVPAASAAGCRSARHHALDRFKSDRRLQPFYHFHAAQRPCNYLMCPVGDATVSGSPSVRPLASFRGTTVAMVGDGVDTVSVNAAHSYHPATAVARAWARPRPRVGTAGYPKYASSQSARV